MEEYLNLLDKIDNGTPEEQNNAELELMNRWYYRNV